VVADGAGRADRARQALARDVLRLDVLARAATAGLRRRRPGGRRVRRDRGAVRRRRDRVRGVRPGAASARDADARAAGAPGSSCG
jgi:hypothetical protein